MGVSSDQTFDESEECGFPFDVGGATEIVVVVFLDYVAAWTEFEFWAVNFGPLVCVYSEGK